jgi:hypothetical protein
MYYVFSTELMYFTDILHKNKKICQLISGESLEPNKFELNAKTGRQMFSNTSWRSFQTCSVA